MNHIFVGRQVYELALDGRVLVYAGYLFRSEEPDDSSQRKEVLVEIGFDYAEGERRDVWL